MDAGKPTPRLEQLIREGALTRGELEQLRRGAPMAMGGRTQEELVLSSFRTEVARLSSQGRLDDAVKKLFAERGALKSDKSDKFKSLEAKACWKQKTIYTSISLCILVMHHYNHV